MARTIVLYSSKYGATETYAHWLGEALDCPVLPAREADPGALQAYDTILFGGGLYASGISGLRRLTRHLALLQGKRLAVFTVGLADPQTTDYSGVLAKNFPGEMRSRFTLFHLRGAMDTAKLGPVHRAMMAALVASLRRKAPAQRTEEESQLLAAYGGRISFLDRQAIAPIVEFVQNP